MLRYIGRRLLVAIPTLLLVITAAFFMMRARPAALRSDRKLLPEIEANVLAKYGMNKPLGAQYVDYLAGRGARRPGTVAEVPRQVVLDILKENYPISLQARPVGDPHRLARGRQPRGHGGAPTEQADRQCGDGGGDPRGVHPDLRHRTAAGAWGSPRSWAGCRPPAGTTGRSPTWCCR
jgi:hypothetical protein